MFWITLSLNQCLLEHWLRIFCQVSSLPIPWAVFKSLLQFILMSFTHRWNRSHLQAGNREERTRLWQYYNAFKPSTVCTRSHGTKATYWGKGPVAHDPVHQQATVVHRAVFCRSCVFDGGSVPQNCSISSTEDVNWVGKKLRSRHPACQGTLFFHELAACFVQRAFTHSPNILCSPIFLREREQNVM